MRHNRLSGRKIAAIIRCFCEDLTATSTAAVVGASRNTVNACFQKFRQLIFREILNESGLETGEFELGESYFGAKRVRGKCGHGTTGKLHVNGIESFWAFAQKRFAKFNGCKNEHFILHLKETEFRFNHRKESLYKVIKKLIKNIP
jgi:hypothetical protein